LISDEVRRRGEDFLRSFFPGATVRAEPDYTAAFYASPAETDVCVIAGTGSLVCSKSARGIVKSGGRGYILGDVGSGYQYGRDAVMRFLDEPEAASPALRAAIRDVFGSEDESVIIPMVYKAQTPATMIAKMLKALAADAKNGEPYALISVERHCEDLAQVIQRHVRRNIPGGDALNLSLAGGVWKAAPVFKDVLTAKVQAGLPERRVTVQRITRPPLHGAVELAKEMSSIGN